MGFEYPVFLVDEKHARYIADEIMPYATKDDLAYLLGAVIAQGVDPHVIIKAWEARKKTLPFSNLEGL